MPVNDPGTRNTRNAAMLISATEGGTFVKLTKTHGLKIANPTDYSEDTGHGQVFKSYIPGLSDFTVTLAKWYDKFNQVLTVASLQRLAYHGLIYPDVSDTENYTKGLFYFAQSERNMDLGNTVDESFDVRLAGSDPTFVINGVTYTGDA